MLSTAMNDATTRRHRTTSFNNHQRQFHHAMIPSHSQSSGSLSSRTYATGITQPSGKPAATATTTTELESIHERIAQLSATAEKPFSIRPRASTSAASADLNTTPGSQHSRLPRRQYFRLQKNNNAYPVTRPSQSETIQRGGRRQPQQQQQQQQDHVHSIWPSQPTNDDEPDDRDKHRIRQLLQETFKDILSEEDRDSAETMVHRIRRHLDEQTSRIQQLESNHARQLALDYRARFELEKRALLKQQEDQFETLKLKYRVGLEQIVDQWLSHEAAEQEQWMDQIQQQTEERMASLEGRWKERTAHLQEQLKRYQG